MNVPTLDLQQMLCFSLYSTANAIVRDYLRPLEKLDLTYPQLLVMVALWQQDDVSISTLSEKTHYDLGTMTPLIRRLEQNGFIDVYLDPNDRRRRNVTLTSRGRALKEQAINVFADLSCKIALTDADVAVILALCQKIKARLSK